MISRFLIQRAPCEDSCENDRACLTEGPRSCEVQIAANKLADLGIALSTAIKDAHLGEPDFKEISNYVGDGLANAMFDHGIIMSDDAWRKLCGREAKT